MTNEQDEEAKQLFHQIISFIIGLIVILGVITSMLAWYVLLYGWEWTGFRGTTTQIEAVMSGQYPDLAIDVTVKPTSKKLWDWLELLGILAIPVVVAGGGFLLNRAQRKNEQRIAKDQEQEAALQSYIDTMKELLLEKELLTSKPNDPVRNVARTLTIATMQRLDGRRNEILLHFLQEARVIKGQEEKQEAVIDFKNANLAGIDLSGVVISNLDLSLANLSKANLSKAILWNPNLALDGLEMFQAVNLQGAILINADLSNAHLCGANLSYTILFDATLSKAYLWAADLRGADLERANLSGAVLHGANMQGTRLNKADLSGADLGRPSSAFVNSRITWSKEASLYEAASLYRGELCEAKLIKADLKGVNLSEANLQGADFSRANLQGANLSEANLQGANLSKADLSNTELRKADLRGANLSKAKLRSANYTDQTQWPTNFDPKSAGASYRG